LDLLRRDRARADRAAPAGTERPPWGLRPRFFPGGGRVRRGRGGPPGGGGGGGPRGRASRRGAPRPPRSRALVVVAAEGATRTPTDSAIVPRLARHRDLTRRPPKRPNAGRESNPASPSRGAVRCLRCFPRHPPVSSRL